jgi:hypothetical protein
MIEKINWPQHRLTKPCGFQQVCKRSGTRALALQADRVALRKPARLVAANVHNFDKRDFNNL